MPAVPRFTAAGPAACAAAVLAGAVGLAEAVELAVGLVSTVGLGEAESSAVELAEALWLDCTLDTGLVDTALAQPAAVRPMSSPTAASLVRTTDGRFTG